MKPLGLWPVLLLLRDDGSRHEAGVMHCNTFVFPKDGCRQIIPTLDPNV